MTTEIAKYLLLRHIRSPKGKHLGNDIIKMILEYIIDVSVIKYNNNSIFSKTYSINNGNYYVSKMFYYDGSLMSINQYKDRCLDGISIHMSPMNYLHSKTTYIKGKKHGKCIKYHENGNIHELLYYNNDKKHGKHEIYTKQCKCESKVWYKYGKIYKKELSR